MIIIASITFGLIVGGLIGYLAPKFGDSTAKIMITVIPMFVGGMAVKHFTESVGATGLYVLGLFVGIILYFVIVRRAKRGYDGEIR